MAGVNESREYKILMTNRQKTLIEGVENVDSFDDQEIVLETKMGLLILKGENLHIVQLNLEEGTMVTDGHCRSLSFEDDKAARGIKGKSKGLIQRILK